jgi:hypothetical protein
MERGFCFSCHLKPISRRNRKYCALHSSQASILWKRRQRQLWKQSGQTYWLDNWKHKSDEERRTYYRNYMRAYRRKAKSRRRYI